MSKFYFEVSLICGSLLVLLVLQLRSALKQRKPLREAEVRFRI
jgi:hypothetical protein